MIKYGSKILGCTSSAGFLYGFFHTKAKNDFKKIGLEKKIPPLLAIATAVLIEPSDIKKIACERKAFRIFAAASATGLSAGFFAGQKLANTLNTPTQPSPSLREA